MELSDTPPANAVLDCVADGIFAVDLDFLITYFNRAAEEIIGVEREQVIGRPCRDVFKASICDCGCGLRRALEQDHPVAMRAVFITNSSGDRFPVCISAGVLRDSQGEVVGAVETIRDLTPVEMIKNEIGQTNLLNFTGRCPAMLMVDDLVPILAESDSAESGDVVDSLQRSLILDALSRTGGNRRAAAEALSIHPTTLWRRARRLGIELPETDGRSNPRRH